MYCIHCGKEIEDTWVKCPYCGADIVNGNQILSNGEENNNKIEQDQPRTEDNTYSYSLGKQEEGNNFHPEENNGTKKEKKLFKEKLATLDLGLEERMTSKVGLLSGGQRQALTLLMATLKKPSLLLLDEHTAALDPKTAKKVLDLTEKIVAKDNLTTLMVTHNMKDAINIGNRLIMMNEGRVIYDVSGQEKKNLKVPDLLKKFEEVSGEDFANDRMLLS